LLTCSGGGSGYTTLQADYTCGLGYVKFSFTYGTSSTGPAGCVRCDPAD